MSDIKKISSLLRPLGLSQNEILAYTALVRLGKATAYEIANESEIKRPTTYLALDELLKKGLILKIPHPKKALYTARSISEFLVTKQKEIENAKEATRLIDEIKQKRAVSTVAFFEGENKTQRALLSGTKNLKEIIAFYGLSKGTDKKYFEPYIAYHKRLDELGIRTRSIIPDHPSIKEFREMDEKAGDESKALPESLFSSRVSIEVYGDEKTKIHFHPTKEIMVIENKYLAKALKEIFELVWRRY